MSFQRVRSLGSFLDRSTSLLLTLGLVGIGLYQWQRWQQDKRLLSKVQPPPPLPPLEDWPEQPKVSVLVAAWNEAGNIEAHIRSFLELRYPNKELVLCAGGLDGTYDLAKRWETEQVKILRQEAGEGKQHALRQCLLASDGPLVVLTDADCVFSNRSFLRLIYPLVGGEARAVTGVAEPRLDQRAKTLVQYQWFNDLVWFLKMPEQADGLLGGNCALLRPVLLEAGGFTEPVQTGTDYHLSMKLAQNGNPVQSAPDSRVETEYPEGILQYLNMWRRWNKNLLIHGARFKAWKDIQGVLAGSVLAITVLALPLLALFAKPVWSMIPLLLCFHASMNRLRRVALGASLASLHPSLPLKVSLPGMAFLDSLAALLGIYDSLHPGRKLNW